MDKVFDTDVPARLDRLPFSRFHWLLVVALGITWILDGLEVTLVGALAGVLTQKGALGLTAGEVGLAGSAYIAGAVLGALLFGDLADRFGRKKLFFVTLGVYTVASIATGLSWNFWSFAALRFLTGAGIGGEYSAINSAIQEFVPARRRGQVDLVLNGSFWVGAAIGALGSLLVLDTGVLPLDVGWRAAFIVGGALAAAAIGLRRFIPESPRWLITHGRPEAAAAVVSRIEREVEERTGMALEAATSRIVFTAPDTAPGHTHAGQVARALIRIYPRRSLLCLTLMTAQAFCYNAIFFTYALILTRFDGVDPARVGWFLLPFALGNFAGPLLMGHLFDRIGRKAMIAATYAVSGAMMLVIGWLFARGLLGAAALTVLWTINFFFASAGASAAYLTAGESFPLEVRARAISIFYALGTAIGGISGPALFGTLIERGARGDILWGYVLGGVLMLAAALVEAAIGVAAERRPLEDVARPLSRLP
jgi:MFS family permease